MIASRSTRADILLQHTNTTSDILQAALRRLQLKIVILDCPYDTIHQDPIVQDLFGKIVGLKVQGYRNQYPYGALPVDLSDYFGTHILLCEQTLHGLLNPLTGFKSVTLDRCKQFHVPFPLEHVMEGEAASAHRSAVHEVLREAGASGRTVAYNSSWTIRPDISADRELRNLCRDVSMFFLVRYYDHARIPHCFAGAAARFKVHLLKEAVGFEYLKSPQGETLPAFPCEPFYGEPIHLMHLRKASADALDWAHLFDGLWESRIVLSAGLAEQSGKAAA